MTFHVPNEARLRCGPLASTDEDGNNGVFMFGRWGLQVRCLASDGMGWEHVSVTIGKRGKPAVKTPTWTQMCWVKSVFWDPEDVVVQFHPAEADYVDNHQHCLHLWRCTQQVQPVPLAIQI